MSVASSYRNKFPMPWDAHPPAAVMRTRQSFSPLSPSTLADVVFVLIAVVVASVALAVVVKFDDVTGRAATLQTLRSNITSTLGNAFPPKFHLPLTTSGIAQSGMFVLHA